MGETYEGTHTCGAERTCTSPGWSWFPEAGFCYRRPTAGATCRGVEVRSDGAIVCTISPQDSWPVDGEAAGDSEVG
jgi:hypothetical protein